MKDAYANAVHTKNLILNNKKKKEEVWIIHAAHNTEINMKALEKKLKTGSGNLRGASEEVLQSIGCKPGMVNAFALLNDTDKKLRVLVDETLLTTAEMVSFHPMTNETSCFLNQANFKKLLELAGHAFETVNFATLAEDIAKEAPKEAKEAPAKKNKVNKDAGKKEDAHQLGIEFKKLENMSMWY